MGITFKNNNGKIDLSLDVIRDIAGYVATKCYGVVGMASKNATDGIVGLLYPESNRKGVEAKMDDDGLCIELHVILQYGINIASISKSVSNRVRYVLQSYTGLKIKYVNIRVEGIRVN